MKRIAFQLMYKMYKGASYRQRCMIRAFFRKHDGGEMNSLWLRKIMKDYHNVTIGTGSYGGCFKPENVNMNTEIGKYCSIAPDVYIYNRDHPRCFVSTHPIFFNERYARIPANNRVEYKKKVIGNDVWIGQNAIILASVRKIGDGAIIGAGSVVTKDVPDYAVAAGAPARIIGYRFDNTAIELIKNSEWWNWDASELKSNNKYFTGLDCFTELVRIKKSGKEREKAQ